MGEMERLARQVEQGRRRHDALLIAAVQARATAQKAVWRARCLRAQWMTTKLIGTARNRAKYASAPLTALDRE